MEKSTILAKVQDLFMKYGLKSVSMDDISRQLGISKKTLYQCVENKRDLILEVFQKHIKEEETAINEITAQSKDCLLYTSPSPRDQRGSRMPSSA